MSNGRYLLPAIAGQGEIMKRNILMVVIAGIISIAAGGLVGCADTSQTSPLYTPPITASETTSTEYTTVQPAIQVVHVPTTVTTVPATANSSTVTTQFSNGAIEKRTTTDYNPAYATIGPPYATTVVSTPPIVEPVPAYATTVVSTTPIVEPVPVVTIPTTTTTRTTTTSDDGGSTVQKQTTTTVTSPGY